jgi:hypothetical protein
MKKDDSKGQKPTTADEVNRAVIQDRRNIAATEADELRTEAHQPTRRPRTCPHE